MRFGDTGTVFWKELQELGEQFGGSRTQWISLAVIGVWFGIILPLRTGSAWLASPLSAAIYMLLAITFAMQPIADSFAGERERHTLETLLASRLSDGAILIGKLLGSLVPASVFALLMFLAGIVATNVRFGHGLLLLPTTMTTAVIVAGVILVPCLYCALGIVISLHAPTVRRAAQMMGLLLMGTIFVPMAVSKLIPAAWLEWVGTQIANHRSGEVVLVIAGILLAIDLAVVGFARARFRRGRLALD